MTLTIVDRAGWDARTPTNPGSRASRRRPKLYLHHTDRLPKSIGLGAAGVRWVQDFHIDTRGWRDIGYPFLYSPATRAVYLGRDPETAGAHTEGSNTVAHALAVLGDYHPPTDDPLPPHAIGDIAAFLRWYEAEGYGDGRFDDGHRGAPGASTACPGDLLYELIDDINRIAAAPPAAEVEEDDMPALEEYTAVVQAEARVTRNMVTQARDRSNETIRLQEAALQIDVAALRREAGLKADPAGDLRLVKRIRNEEGFGLDGVRRELARLQAR